MARRGENIRKRSDGRWEARYLYGHQKDGKAKYKYIYGKTYTEVREAKNLLIKQRGSQNLESSKSKTNFYQLLEDWLAFTEVNVKPSTFSRYTFLVRKHIEPELGNILLTNLTNEDIDQFTKEKLKNGNLNRKGGLSAKTVTDILSIIKRVLSFGMERNYCCIPNIVIHCPRQNTSPIQIFTIEDQQKLENYIFENMDSLHLGILISLYMGLRIGEVCALCWKDFDFENQILSVSRTILRISNTNLNSDQKTKVIITEPKTETSKRMIPIPSFLTSVLLKYRKENSCYTLTGNHSWMEPRQYYRKYKQILKHCNLENFNYHALRHTFATRCVENEFDIKSLSEILGHANVSTTIQRYVHPSMNLKRQHMNKLETITICGQFSGQNSPQISILSDKTSESLRL